MSAPAFVIEITEQGWIGSEPEHVRDDLCSPGRLRLVIGGREIAPGDPDEDYTISTSALALLRTLQSEHSPERPVADRLVLHCGMLSMGTCPIGIDWSVTHGGETVHLADVVRYPTTSVREAVRFPELAVDVALGEYRRSVAALAEKAKEPFAGAEKDVRGYEDEWEAFWDEYEARLGRARAALGS